MKKWLIGLVAIAGLTVAIVVVLTRGGSPPDSNLFRVVVFQVVQHPALNDMDLRFRQRMSEVSDGRVVIVETLYANGDAEATERIATKIVTEAFDLAFVIGTEQARSLRSKTDEIPIVLGGATDPVGSGLVEAWDRPGGNITGTSDLVPVGAHLDHLREILPDVSRVAIIFNPAEGNSRAVVSIFERECIERGITPVQRTVTQSSELRSAALSLSGQVDAILAPTDATVQSAIASLVTAAAEVSLPVCAVDRSAVEKGALFAIGFDYGEFGRISADMAADILLNGDSPSTMPLRTAETIELFVNPSAFDALGIVIPPDWSDVATVIGGGP